MNCSCVKNKNSVDCMGTKFYHPRSLSPAAAPATAPATAPPNNIPKYVPNIDKPVIINPPNNNSGYTQIPGVGQKGGTCTSCGQIPVVPQSGGSFYKPAAPIPGPMVGSAWGAPVNQWPGMNNIDNDRNYLKSYDANNNIIANDPQLQMSMNDSGYNTMNSMVGGYTYNKKSTASSKSMRSKSRAVRGGGLVPQDLVNLGNDFTFNLKSAYNALNGYKAPVDPLPYKDQLSHSLNTNKLLL
jgi:hypothetical protein